MFQTLILAREHKSDAGVLISDKPSAIPPDSEFVATLVTDKVRLKWIRRVLKVICEEISQGSPSTAKDSRCCIASVNRSISLSVKLKVWQRAEHSESTFEDVKFLNEKVQAIICGAISNSSRPATLSSCERSCTPHSATVSWNISMNCATSSPEHSAKMDVKTGFSMAGSNFSQVGSPLHSTSNSRRLGDTATGRGSGNDEPEFLQRRELDDVSERRGRHG